MHTKTFCILALLGVFPVAFVCPNFVGPYCLIVGLSALLLPTFTAPAAKYFKDDKGWYAILSKGGQNFKITKHGAFIQMGDAYMPCACPSTKVAAKVDQLNREGKDYSLPLVSLVCLLGVGIFLPKTFHDWLTPETFILLQNAQTWINGILIGLAILAVVSATVWHIGALKLKIDLNSEQVDFEVLEIPKNLEATVLPDLLVRTLPGESEAEFLKRIEAAKKIAEQEGAKVIVTPKGNSVWAILDGENVAMLNRTKGSDTLGVSAVESPMFEGSKQYKRNLFWFLRSYVESQGIAQRQIAAQSQEFAKHVKEIGGTAFALLLCLNCFAQNNSYQAWDYMGQGYYSKPPSGIVVFGFEKLSFRVSSDGQKTYKDLLEHAASFQDDGEYGRLKAVRLNDILLARINAATRDSLNRAAELKKVEPKEKTLPFVERQTPGMMDGVKAYFSEVQTEQRISDREAAAQEFSKRYMKNIRKDLLSLLQTLFGFFFWILLAPSGIFWVVAQIASKESAIFSNGVPVFGRFANWVHGWSAGTLGVLVIFSAAFCVLYATLAWFIDMPLLFGVICFVSFTSFVAWVAQKIIPNKRVLGGQPYSGGDRGGMNPQLRG